MKIKEIMKLKADSNTDTLILKEVFGLDPLDPIQGDDIPRYTKTSVTQWMSRNFFQAAWIGTNTPLIWCVITH